MRYRPCDCRRLSGPPRQPQLVYEMPERADRQTGQCRGSLHRPFLGGPLSLSATVLRTGPGRGQGLRRPKPRPGPDGRDSRGVRVHQHPGPHNVLAASSFFLLSHRSGGLSSASNRRGLPRRRHLGPWADRASRRRAHSRFARCTCGALSIRDPSATSPDSV